MNTYKEMIYMVLDELHGYSDDFSYTEDHVAFLLDKYRAFILKRICKFKKNNTRI